MRHDQLIVSCDCSHLAQFLLAVIARWHIECPGAMFEHNTLTCHNYIHRNDHVIQDRICRYLAETFSPQGVEGSGHTDHRMEATLLLSDEFLVTPVRVNTFAKFSHAVGLEHELPTCRTDERIREVLDQVPDGVRVEPLSCIGEQDDFIVTTGHGIIQTGGLPTAHGECEQGHPAI